MRRAKHRHEVCRRGHESRSGQIRPDSSTIDAERSEVTEQTHTPATQIHPSQPATVPALLRLLGIPDVPVLRHHDALAAWLEHNTPSRELRISLRANGYGLLLPPPRRDMRPPLSAVKSVTPGDTSALERFTTPPARRSA
jgi:hypothetical protein